MRLGAACRTASCLALSIALALECMPVAAYAETAAEDLSESTAAELVEDPEATEDAQSAAGEGQAAGLADDEAAVSEEADVVSGDATSEEALSGGETSIVAEDASGAHEEATGNNDASGAQAAPVNAAPTADVSAGQAAETASKPSPEPELTAQGRWYSIAKATVTYQETWTYTGKPIKPKVTVTYKGVTLKEGVHYRVGYEGTQPGEGCIFVETIDDSDSDSFEYQICYFNIVKAGTWKHLSGGWRYYYTKSSYYKRRTQIIDGAYYGFNKSGYMVTGWQRSGDLMGIGDRWMYFDGSGKMARGWKKIGGLWYYFTTTQKPDLPRGSMYTGLHNISGKYYYFSSSGAMVTGWKKLSGTWYYFGSDGAAKTGWQKIDGSWYWFNAKGKMATGRKTIDGKSYYFGSSGAMRTGWQKISGKYYYFYSSGAMAKSTWVGNYHVNAKGVWDKSR